MLIGLFIRNFFKIGFFDAKLKINFISRICSRILIYWLYWFFRPSSLRLILINFGYSFNHYGTRVITDLFSDEKWFHWNDVACWIWNMCRLQLKCACTCVYVWGNCYSAHVLSLYFWGKFLSNQQWWMIS